MTIAAIVPAAGASLRMRRPKLLIEFDGRPLIARVVATLIEAGVDRVVVVAPPADAPEGPAVADAAEAAGAVVLSPSTRPESMRDSIELGVAEIDRLDPPPRAVLIVPADSPRLGAGTVARLVDAWRARPDRIMAPTFGGRRGHPPVFPWPMLRAVRDLPPGVGVNQLLVTHADMIDPVPMETDSVLGDMDTPDDARRLRTWPVRLFAVARQRAGRVEVTVALPCPATVGDLRRALAEQHPALATLATSVRVAVDDEYADDAAPLPPDARLALIPPVSGGQR
ncbi:NTP transferase domain-containing protein [Paludisphaera sp.]|uniref:NTP transferase domain-containing protein n=1 Tax=Paludisphaera sp. TaxID=2017432 RepID=UPI00301BA065